MKKVYIVLLHQVDNTSELTLSTYVFKNYDRARQCFTELLIQEREVAIRNEWIIEENINSFCAYESGHYVENHTLVEIREEDIC